MIQYVEKDRLSKFFTVTRLAHIYIILLEDRKSLKYWVPFMIASSFSATMGNDVSG